VEVVPQDLGRQDRKGGIEGSTPLTPAYLTLHDYIEFKIT
jgi:hypothetical protein